MIFNQVRLHLQVEKASDIVVVGHGTNIHKSVLKGGRIRPSKKLWPNIQKYPRTWIKVWAGILTDYIEPLLLQKPLGKRHHNHMDHQMQMAEANKYKSVVKYRNRWYKKGRKKMIYC